MKGRNDRAPVRFAPSRDSRHVSATVFRFVNTPITASRFCVAVNVDFRPICMPSSQVMQPASPRKGLSTHFRGSHRPGIHVDALRTVGEDRVAQGAAFFPPSRRRNAVNASRELGPSSLLVSLVGADGPDLPMAGGK